MEISHCATLWLGIMLYYYFSSKGAITSKIKHAIKLRKSHIVNYANHQHSPFARRRQDVSNFISPLSFGKSFMKIRSRERLSHIFDGRNKNKKNAKKTSAKHKRIRLLPEGGCVNKQLQ